jgi:hypothetical protein
MADIASLLDQTLRAAGVPIVGVSIGVVNDRATWVVQYADTATAAQQTQGESIRATFDATAPAVTSAQLDRDADSALASAKATCALVLDTELGRALTAADAPAVRAKFTKYRTYYKFIVNNGL